MHQTTNFISFSNTIVMADNETNRDESPRRSYAEAAGGVAAPPGPSREPARQNEDVMRELVALRAAVAQLQRQQQPQPPQPPRPPRTQPRRRRRPRRPRRRRRPSRRSCRQRTPASRCGRGRTVETAAAGGKSGTRHLPLLLPLVILVDGGPATPPPINK
ncbi:sterile alpha motif domain-containing protein 1-like [Athalia rosae]|uniref:sterile alpha motif domain-containing protein 1-like n=1 Tax=Athalia rosae TaxID=37344 RepID=UPI00203360AB|nr:sterile alpha motif domain-containing protein 1-like [Athalia rosae]